MLYTISNNVISITVNSVGAELKSLRKDGVEYIHQDDPKTWNRSAPFLFPAIGCFKNKETFFDGKSYKLPKHGFLRDMKMTLVSKTDNSLIFETNDNEETLNCYPFKFLFKVSYTLVDSTVSIKLEVINPNKNVLPFNLGLHPAFRIPLFEGEKFEDYQIKFNKKASYKVPTVQLTDGLIDWDLTSRVFTDLEVLPLNYDDYQNDALVFDNVNFKEMILSNPETNFGIKLAFDNFKTVGIWTPNHVKANFVCLEPWIGCADAPNSTGNFVDKKDIINLDSDETFTTTYTITVLK